MTNGQNEGMRVLEFVGDAIYDQPFVLSRPAVRGENEGMRVLEMSDNIAVESTPPSVRILPMNAEMEFNGRSIEEVQRTFFLNELLRPEKPPGKYFYRKRGIRAKTGSIVLFQYQGRIIASATLVGVERFKSPEKGIYRGALHFDAASVQVFDPVDSDAVSSIWPDFKGFSQAPQSLDPEGYRVFFSRLTGVVRPQQ